MRASLHDLSPAVLAVLLLVIVVGPMALVTWLTKRDEPTPDNSEALMTSTTALVGGTFALLAAFIIVSLVNTGDGANEGVRSEAAAAEAFATEASRLPPPLDTQLVDQTIDYLELVINDEWKVMHEADAVSDPADAASERLLTTMFDSPSASTGDVYDSRYELALRSLDRLESSRALRLNSNREPLSSLLWAVLLVSALLVCVTAVAFPAGERRWRKWLQVLAIGTLVATVLFVIFSLEQPYSGFLKIEPRPYRIAVNELRGR
jgi:4-amino-4-deoxy-L-arabinose transferase-like glycosyltransferase